MVTNRLFFVSVAALAVTEPTHAPAQFPRMRDSAGIHIVENGPRSKAPIAFKLSDKPTFDFGGLKDNPDDELNKNSAYLRYIRLSDGRYVVDDQEKLRFLDPSGKQLRVVGQKGQGPGEFQYVDALCRTRGDTIVAADPGNSRVTVFDKNGTMVREIPVGRTYVLREGCFDDGTFLMEETLRPAGEPATIQLVHRRLDGTVLGTTGGFWSGPTNLFITMRLMFAAQGHQAYVVDPRTNEVRVYNPQGTLTGIIRTADPIEKTTAAEQAAMVPRVRPATSDQAIMDRFAERMRTEPKPAEWPTFGRVMVDPDGRLWVQDYEKDRKAPNLWTGFDAAGRMLGRFSMPAALKNGEPRIVAFMSGGVLIEHDDDDGAHHLTTYALVPVPGAKPQ